MKHACSQGPLLLALKRGLWEQGCFWSVQHFYWSLRIAMHPRGLNENFTIINPFLSVLSGVAHRFGPPAFNIGSQHIVLTATSVWHVLLVTAMVSSPAWINVMLLKNKIKKLASQKENGLMNDLYFALFKATDLLALVCGNWLYISLIILDNLAPFHLFYLFKLFFTSE